MAEFRGKLYIFVETSQEEETPAHAKDPDDIFGQRDPGDRLWYLIGWAVSDNVRGSYCARTSTSKLRAFGTFIECMDFVRKKRRSRRKATFHPVYEINGRKSIVTSLEQILRLDDDSARTEHSGPSGEAADAVLNALTEKVGKIVAANALALLRTFDREGEAAARSLFSNATYERLWRVLHEAALTDGRHPSFPSPPGTA